MPVRSDRLGAGILGAAINHLVLTVPPAATVLVKSVYGYSGASAASRVLLHGTPAGGTQLAIIEIATTPQKAWRWDGWWALDPGTELRIQNLADGNQFYWISGARLPGAAPELPGTKPT